MSRVDESVDDLREIAEIIKGTSKSVPHIEDIETKMLEYNLERCPTCNTWVEAHSRIPDDSLRDEPDDFCEWCRTDSKKEIPQ